jgi:hypothetical protein
MMMRRDPLAESLRAALDAETSGRAEHADDDALLARAIDRAMSAPVASTTSAASTGALRALSGARAARLRTLRWALPAAAALVASAAMAAIYMNRSPSTGPSNDTTHPSHETVAPPVSAPAASPAPPAHVSGPPTVSIDDLPSVALAPHASSHPVIAAPSAASAADLFRDANAARRTGEVDKAVDLYTTLVTRHAETPEALAARVSLGRVLLDRRGDAAGALVQFDAYLKSSASDGALAEEARLGRALVFQRQGRQEEERRAWHELLERHPDSLYASRARERLRAIAPAAIAPAPSSPPP